ncbi:MAG: hypothetical protein ABL925_07965, partial [Methylococcales bacterium]
MLATTIRTDEDLPTMIEPVAMKDFFITFFSSALIIMAGASYALLYAWSKLRANSTIKMAAYAAYSVLLVSVYILTGAANFSGYWLSLSLVMVLGYFFAPIAIWQLCVKTHAFETSTPI